MDNYRWLGIAIIVVVILTIFGIVLFDSRNKKKAEKKQKAVEATHTNLVNNLFIKMSPKNLRSQIEDATFGTTAYELDMLNDGSIHLYREDIQVAVEKQEMGAKAELNTVKDERDKAAAKIAVGLVKADKFLDIVEGEYYIAFNKACQKELNAQFTDVSLSLINGDNKYLSDTSHQKAIASLIQEREQFEKDLFCLRRDIKQARNNEYEMYHYFRSCDDALDEDIGSKKGFWRFEEFLIENLAAEHFESLFNDALALITRMASEMKDFLDIVNAEMDSKKNLSEIQEVHKKSSDDFEKWKKWKEDYEKLKKLEDDSDRFKL